MKRKGEYSVSKRTVRAFIIMAIILIPISFGMILAGMQLTRDRESAQNELKMNVLARLVANENDMLDAAKEQFDRNLSAHMRMMTASLKAFVTGDGYTGPRVLPDGFVVELRGDKVILPDGVPEGRMNITRELIEDSLESGGMRTGRLYADAEAVGDASPSSGADGGTPLPAGVYYLSFGEIAENLIYVDLTARSVFEDEVNIYFAKNDMAVESENEGFGGITLVVHEGEDGVELLRSYGDAGSVKRLSDLGITPEQIEQRAPIMTVNDTAYSCSYSTLQRDWDGRENPVMVQMLPIVSIGMSSVVQTLIICYAMALILFNLIVYVMSVQKHVRDHVLTEEQAARYNPRKLRVRMINAGVVGVLAIFSVSLIVTGVGQLYNELRYGRDTLRVFSKQREQVDQYQSEAVGKNQGNWYVYYGEQIASLLSAHPEQATREKLQEYCDILDVDFIMLFDSDGNETLCSRDYVGFTLDKGLGSNSSDFRRLLYGVSSIVHDVSTDSFTGLERQMIGVKLPASDSGTKHGALILALMPEQVRQAADLNRFDEQSTVFATNGTRCFIADANTGVILHDSDASMVGLTIEECGLSEKSLQDGYMDFDVVNGTRCFVVTSKYDGSIYYYARESRRMFDNVLVFGIASTLLFALATAIILFYVLVGYSEAVYAEWAVVCMPAEMLGLARKHDAQAQKKTERAARAEEIRKRTGGWIKTLLDRLSGMIHWNERLPEEKTSFVFKVSLLTLVISWTNLLFSKNMIYNKFDSLAGFLLKGDWMRGANLFSFCSILLIIAYAILINLISRAILFILSGFLLGKGQTLCRLLHSFVKYFSLFVVLYFILNYLGFPIGTVVGSLSITTLALSFGAKDLAADILAGLSIVFERTFKVGDIVEIKGNRGMVQEIGVRSTKLVILPANNVLVISNHEISDVLNLTQDVSMHTLEIRIVAPESLERLEEMLNREMPLIQQKNDRVISLRYLGVTALGSGNSTGNPSIITLGIAAYCQEADVDDVMLFVNREIRLLSEREGFTIV